MIVNVEGTFYNLCDEHQVLYLPIQVCSRCASRERQHRDTLDGLKALVDDQGQQITDLSQKVIALEHQRISDLEAHNALARASEQLLAQVERMLAQPEHATVYSVDCSCGFHADSYTPMAYFCCPQCGAARVE